MTSLLADGSLRCIDPRTGTDVALVPATAPADVPARIAACRQAQRGWARLGLSDRVSAMRPALRRLNERGPELAALIGEEHGKGRTEAYFSELLGAADVLATHFAVDRRWLKADRVPIDPLAYPGKKARVEHLPRGVVGLITPWNYPLALPMRTLVPALLAGNGVVFKPSEHTPRVGAAIAELFEGLLPDGLLQLVQGAGDVGAALAGDPGVDAVVFTGSVRAGKAVAKAAAEHMTPVSLELGGKDAAIVLADADLDRAAAGIAWAAFHNSGQNCAAIERVYVDRGVYEPFVEKLVAEVKQLRSDGEQAEVGPLTTEAQFTIVNGQLAEAREAGATVACGGEASGQGWGFAPTVLTDVPEGCGVWTEETFGPLLPVAAVDSPYDAVAKVNESRYGLSVSVWTGSAGRGEEVARRCEVGMAYVNNHAFSGSIPTSPWIGTKDSGTGVTGSPLAMKFLTRPQLVLVDRNRGKDLWWFPLNAVAQRIAETALAEKAAGIFQKLALNLRLLGLLGKRWTD